jgi:putative oxidoreductase
MKDDRLLLLARVLLAALFIVSGFGKLSNPAGFAGMLGKIGMPAPEIMAYAVGLFELFGGLAVLAGVMLAPVCYLLAAFCIATAFIAHFGDATQLLKNFGLAGGFLALAEAGAGQYAVQRSVRRF